MFVNILKEKGISPDDYLKNVKLIADKYGYDKNKLIFSSNPKKKLEYDGVNFGSSSNNDFIIYLFKTDEETAFKKRNQYLARATKIKGDWKNNDNSPNNLAIRILWLG
jgi:hypothetical protein